MKENDRLHRSRRKVLQTVGTSATVGAVGLGALTGSAAAWSRKTVDFKGCSRVWIVVDQTDLNREPPAVARVVFALPDGTTACRDVAFTGEGTTQIYQQYGNSPVRIVTVGENEKVLGVIFYNYRKEDRLSSPSCIVTNESQCAMTPNTPSINDASCVQDARERGGYDCPDSIADGDSGGENKNDKETGSKTSRPPTDVHNDGILSTLTDILRIK